MRIVNKTPHIVNYYNSEMVTAFPSEGVARCKEIIKPVDHHHHCPVKLTVATYGDVVGLPEPMADTIYIVSALVRAAMPARKDLVSPGVLIRNPDGGVIGCSSFHCNL
jgi:hypothetical protein